MKIHFPLIVITIFCSLTIFSQQNNLDVEGHAKIRGNIDINHMDDTTSVLIGRNAGINSDFSNETHITFVGSNSGFNNTTGIQNSFFGFESGKENTTGYANSFFGWHAGLENTEGFGNSFFGNGTGNENTIGTHNSFFGNSVGLFNTSGNENSFFGTNAGLYNQSGDKNSAFGSLAGVDNTIGNRNTFIGSRADVLTLGDSLDRAIAIGYNAKVDCSHCAVIGGTGVDAVNVGIGINNPDVKLDVSDIIRVGGNAYPTSGKGLELVYDSTNHTSLIQSYDRDLNQWGKLYLGEGNVGIGTLIPTTKLDVTGTTSVGEPGDGNVLLNLKSDRSWAFKQKGTGSATAMELTSIGGGGNKNFIINTSGNVGIGTTSPNHPLDMASGAHVTSGRCLDKL